MLEAAKAATDAVAHKRTKADNEMRWFGQDDRNARLIAIKSFKQYLADLCLSLSNATPYTTEIDPDASLDEIFSTLKQSEAVASHLYRHEYLFDVPSHYKTKDDASGAVPRGALGSRLF